MLLFGVILALLAVLLQFLEYRYLIGSLDVAVYTSVVATVFTIVGIWIGFNLWQNRKEGRESTIKINKANIEELNLNTREYEILELIARGYTNQQIAGKLFLALPTIKTHTSNLYSKLGVQSRTQAIHKAQLALLSWRSFRWA
jgi:DNA-binding NarL/FixJ family response regulator